MKRFIPKILLGILTVALVATTFFVDEKFGAAAGGSDQFPVDVNVTESKPGAQFFPKDGGYFLDAGGARLSLRVDDNVVLRLSPQSTATLKLSTESDGSRKILLIPGDGRFWLNTTFSTASIEIKTRGLTLSAHPGVYDADYRGGVLKLRSVRHFLTVALLPDHEVVVPEGRMMEISDSKIQKNADVLGKLHFSKLMKEFPFLLSKNDNWVEKNMADDATFFESYRNAILAKIRKEGSSVPDNEGSLFSQLGSGASRVSQRLLFDSKKRRAASVKNAFEYFDAGVSRLLVSDRLGADRRFFQFKEAAKIIAGDASSDAAWTTQFALRQNQFAFATPDDVFFKAKTVLRDAAKQTLVQELTHLFEDTLDVAASGADAETREKVLSSLRRFGAEASQKAALLRSSSDELFFLALMLNDFLNQHEVFLRDEFLKMVSVLQNAHLSFLPRDEAQDERQFFVGEKLRQMTRLKSMIEREDVPFQEGRAAFLALASEIDALKPTFSDTAVVAYFDDQMDAFRPLLAFLRSPQAEHLTVGFTKSFQDYKSSQDEVTKVIELLSNAGGGEQISASRREEIANAITNDLGPLGITQIQMYLPDSEEDSRVKISSAQFEGTTFVAMYDTTRKVFSDLQINNEKIPNAVRLANFRKFYLVKLGRFALSSEQSVESLTEQEAPTLSLLAKVTKAKLKDDLDMAKIMVEDKYLGFENVEQGMVHVRLAKIGNGTEAKVFSFDVLVKTGAVSNLRVQTVVGEIPVNDSFVLKELPTKVEQIFARAVFEKEREEELMKKEQEKMGTTTQM